MINDIYSDLYITLKLLNIVYISPFIGSNDKYLYFIIHIYILIMDKLNLLIFEQPIMHSSWTSGL